MQASPGQTVTVRELTVAAMGTEGNIKKPTVVAVA